MDKWDGERGVGHFSVGLGRLISRKEGVQKRWLRSKFGLTSKVDYAVEEMRLRKSQRNK